MEKEEALAEFIKGLRIALNSASAYFKEHPGFIKSVHNFKQNIDNLLPFLNPARIAFASESLFIDGRYFRGLPMYTELAASFHLRKIKSIQFMRGVSQQELADLLSAVAGPRRDILRQGGINNIVGQQLRHIVVEELDYSQLLNDDKDLIDAWIYACKKAIETNDKERISGCADDFARVISRVELKELFQDKGLQKAIFGLLNYLKDNEKTRFKACALELINNFIEYKYTLIDAQIAELNVYLEHLNEQDFADILWQQLLSNKSFDALSMNLFSRLAGDGRQKGIVSILLGKVNNNDSLQSNPEAAKRIDGLLKKASCGPDMPDVYRNTLFSLLQRISFDETITFDRVLLQTNYRFILVNLLESENNEKRLSLISAKVLEEIEKAGCEKDAAFLMTLLDVLKRPRKISPDIAVLFDNMQQGIFAVVEVLIWEDQISLETRSLARSLTALSEDAEFYLDKIFMENKSNSSVLELFFRFFPDERNLFEQRFKERHADADFLMKILRDIKEMDPKLSLEVLKGLFGVSGEFIKIQILKAMGEISDTDEAFLFSLLEKKDISLKKEALSILAKKPDALERTLKILFDIPNFLGTRNNLILDNLIAVEQADFKAANVWLENMDKKKSIWTIVVRRKARQILRSWNDGKD